MIEELWRPVVNYETIFEISNLGRLKRIATGNILKQNKIGKGYLACVVSLGSRSKQKALKIHRLVAGAFIPNPENKPVVNHKDGNKLNNRVSNLEWCTISDNNKHAARLNLINTSTYRKVSDEDIKYIREMDGIVSRKDLAIEFDVDVSTIGRIIRNVNWKYIK